MAHNQGRTYLDKKAIELDGGPMYPRLLCQTDKKAQAKYIYSFGKSYPSLPTIREYRHRMRNLPWWQNMKRGMFLAPDEFSVICSNFTLP